MRKADSAMSIPHLNPSSLQEGASSCALNSDIDIKENDLLKLSRSTLENLLYDHTTRKNIFWATDNYSERGEGYQFFDCISVEAITGENGDVIVPRALKTRQQQQQRSREMAEVFTPSWICNKQNNLIDNAWFGRENVFNTEIDNPDGSHTWIPTTGKIEFPEGKSWGKYVCENRLEITCGEAPYLVSRYDTVTGLPLPIEMRIGLLDRKLRVVSENAHSERRWLECARNAVRSTYGFEWQGDNLFLARENILFSVADHYRARYGRELSTTSLMTFSKIISRNIWQMDGLKFVIPGSCKTIRTTLVNLLGETTVSEEPCKGCKTGDHSKHNGIYATIGDWKKDKDSKSPKEIIEFYKLISSRP